MSTELSGHLGELFDRFLELLDYAPEHDPDLPYNLGFWLKTFLGAELWRIEVDHGRPVIPDSVLDHRLNEFGHQLVPWETFRSAVRAELERLNQRGRGVDEIFLVRALRNEFDAIMERNSYTGKINQDLEERRADLNDPVLIERLRSLHLSESEEAFQRQIDSMRDRLQPVSPEETERRQAAYAEWIVVRDELLGDDVLETFMMRRANAG